MRSNAYVFLSLFALISASSYGQHMSVPINKSIHQLYEIDLSAKGMLFHTSIKPYLFSDVSNTVSSESIDHTKKAKSPVNGKRFTTVWDHIINEHLLLVNEDNFQASGDIIFDWNIGQDFENNKQTFQNTRGYWIQGNIGKQFSFSSTFYENQAKFPGYVDSFVQLQGVVPGEGRVKNFKGTAYDYSASVGYISYSPSKYFNFQLGHDKNFIGDGYRSLILSDNSFYYPFFKISTTIWKIKYVNLYTQFTDMSKKTPWNGFGKKYGSFHYLSWAIGKRFQLGYFEGLIWQNEDSTGFRGLDFNYVNPVIFFRPVEFNLGSPDNVLMGLNANFKISDRTMAYGQFLLDDLNFGQTRKGGIGFFQNKFGYQLGLKAYNLFKINRLFGLMEYNTVRPYTYAHKTLTQNYTHFGQALAHPIGANFREGLIRIGYGIKRFDMEAELMYANYGVDTIGSHFGKNIFRSDFDTDNKSFGNKTGQGVETDLYYGDLRLSYLINPKNNMRFSLGIIYRKESSSISSNITNFVYLGVSTQLFNRYYDF